MDHEAPAQADQKSKPKWLRYVLMVLLLEKIIQHTVVTLAFYFDWGKIGSTVVVSPQLLMVSGAVVAVLFALSLWGMAKQTRWVIPLVIGLALFDMLGEFVAQGRIDIVLNVSFTVATLLLVLVLVYRRQGRSQAPA